MGIGVYRGVHMIFINEYNKFKICLKSSAAHIVELENSETGNITRINNSLDSIPQNIQRLNEKLDRLNNEYKSAKIESKRTFPKEQEYLEICKRLSELNVELDSEKECEETIQDKLESIKNNYFSNENSYRNIEYER